MKYALLVTALMVSATPAFAQQPTDRPDRTINVNATGTVQREPERAVLTVAVESNATTAQLAAQANARKMDAVIGALRRLNIAPPKVRTVSYELHPEYAQPTRERPNPGLRVIGYRAINMVVVDIDTIARVGAVIDATVAAGANRVHNLSFELRDTESARLEALRLATQRARAEAEVLATAAGQRLGPPLSISSSYYFEPRRYRMAAEMGGVAMAAPAAMPTPVEGGTLNIVANVHIVFRMEDR